MNEFNPEGKDIRFIDSHYKDLFRVPDGGFIQINYPDETVLKQCTFIDEYHTQVGNNVFHICQFAEIMERNGNYYQAEPAIEGDEAAWKVGKDRVLAIQTCDDGYDYTLFDSDFNEIDGGQLDNPDMSMIEIRNEILADYKLEHRDLRAMVYEDVMELAEQKAMQAFSVGSDDLATKLDRFAESYDPYEYRDSVDDAEQNIEQIRSDLEQGKTEGFHEFLDSVLEECDDKAVLEEAKALKKELESIDRKPSVLAQLSKQADSPAMSKSHKSKEPER